MKKILLFITIALAIIFAAGCGKEEKDLPVEITLMHGYGGTLESYGSMQKIYQEFSEKYPDIHLNTIAYMNNEIAVDKANDMLAVGKMPDIVSTNSLSYYVDNAVKVGMAMDLMPYIKEDKDWKEQIYQGVFETWETKEGHLYTIPDGLELAGFWYNEEYLKKAGFSNGEEVNIPETWDEFMSMVQGVKKWIDHTGQNISICYSDSVLLEEYVFPARLAGESQNALDATQGKKNCINKKELTNTLRDLSQLKSYSKHVPNVVSSRQKFMDGEAVFYFNGAWEAKELQKSELRDKFAYANYPGFNGKTISYISPPSGYVLAKQEDQRKAEACICFLKYMLSDEVQKRIATETGQVPCNPKIDIDEITDSKSLLRKAIETVNKADIHINAITCEWNNEKQQVVKKYFGEESFGEQQIDKILDVLNTAKGKLYDEKEKD